jgi:hypothetical protein
MSARKLGAICALLAATLNLIGCESSRDSPDRQFQKQVKRAQECRELQDKLVGGQPLTPERAPGRPITAKGAAPVAGQQGRYAPQ